MNVNYQKTRELMVENQLRPNRIKDANILNIFKEIPKEDFVPKEINSLPYSDTEISLTNNRGYLKNLHLAQLIHYSDIKKNHKILHIGALTGYVSTLFSKLCFEVLVIETREDLTLKLQKNINDFNLKNIKIVSGSFEEGFPSEGPYDRIIIDTPIKKLNNKILDQLDQNLGKIVIIEKEKNNLNKAFKITRNKNNFSKEYLFDVFSNYQLFYEKEGFIF